jgi:hypothetical protein
MSPIHDVSCFQAAREDVVGVKVGTAPRRRSIAIANTSFDFTRVEYAIANCRAAAKGRDVLGSDMAAWSGRDADSRMNGGCRKLICDEDTSAKTKFFEPQSWATPGNAFAAGSAKTIQQSHNKHFGRVYALAEPEAGALRRSRRSEPGG